MPWLKNKTEKKCKLLSRRKNLQRSQVVRRLTSKTRSSNSSILRQIQMIRIVIRSALLFHLHLRPDSSSLCIPEMISIKSSNGFLWESMGRNEKCCFIVLQTTPKLIQKETFLMIQLLQSFHFLHRKLARKHKNIGMNLIKPNTKVFLCKEVRWSKSGSLQLNWISHSINYLHSRRDRRTLHFRG